MGPWPACFAKGAATSPTHTSFSFFFFVFFHGHSSRQGAPPAACAPAFPIFEDQNPQKQQANRVFFFGAPSCSRPFFCSSVGKRPACVIWCSEPITCSSLRTDEHPVQHSSWHGAQVQVLVSVPLQCAAGTSSSSTHPKTRQKPQHCCYENNNTRKHATRDTR